MKCTGNCNQGRNCNCYDKYNKTKFHITFLKEEKMTRSILITTLLALALFACSKQETPAPTTDAAVATPAAEVAPVEAAPAAPAEAAK